MSQDGKVLMTPYAKSFGLSVFKVKGWNNDINGVLKRKDGAWSIFTNANHSEKHRRFVMSLCIADYILHKEAVVYDQLLRNHLSVEQQSSSKQKALNILMPWDLINHHVSNGIETVEGLAEKMCVSNSAMSIRLGFPFEA